jgi:hypothetical protein
MQLCKPVRMPRHINHASGKAKTVCVTACLTALGIPFDGFQVTGDLGKPNYLSIANRFGFSTRSRKSKLPAKPTVGNSRQAIRKMSDGPTDIYMVVLYGNHYGKKRYCHLVLMNGEGDVVVDTASSQVKRDHRKIFSIHKVTKLH